MRIPLFIAGIVAAGLTATAPPFQEEISVKKATPIITVDDVDACLPFWAERLGFTITATVPHEDATGFAMLSKGGVELMYQSRASIDADLGASGAPEGLGTELTRGTVTLFVEVESLDDVVAAMDGIEIVVPRRQTFYGMDEMFVRAPCGTLVGFAARLPEAD